MIDDRQRTFEVARDDLHATRIVEAEAPGVPPGGAVLRVEAFGLSANNVTYATLGRALRYWDFFPAAADGWGRIPAWGFLRVLASEAPGLAEGARVFGYVPMSTHLTVMPAQAGPAGFVDASAHRAELPPAYNGYRDLAAGGAEPVPDDLQILLRPLYFVAFTLDAFLADEDTFGARTVLLTSASSKSALGTAYLLAARGLDVVALTAAANVEAVTATGIYADVVAYDAVGDLPVTDAVLLDFAGRGGLRAAVHERLGDRLRHSAGVGWTHATSPPEPADAAAAPDATMFFAPDHLRRLGRELGRAELDARYERSWAGFAGWAAGRLDVRHGSGPEAVEEAYRRLVDGRVEPLTGDVLSM